MIRGILRELFDEYGDLIEVEEWKHEESEDPNKAPENSGTLPNAQDTMGGEHD